MPDTGGDLSFSIRSAGIDDRRAIKKLIRKAHINPFGLDWRRFVLAVDTQGDIIGSGQLKRHSGGTIELASLAVEKKYRGNGIGGEIINYLGCVGRRRQ